MDRTSLFKLTDIMMLSSQSFMVIGAAYFGFAENDPQGINHLIGSIMFLIGIVFMLTSLVVWKIGTKE